MCCFVPNYLQVALYFVDGESCNQKESMLPWHSGSAAGCSFIKIHIGCLAKSEFAARKTKMSQSSRLSRLLKARNVEPNSKFDEFY